MGDGTNSPFGNGQGGAGGSMNGNDFKTNPGGNPGGTGGGQPDSFGQSRPQSAGQDSDINPNEIPDGGKDLFADKSQDAGNPIGTGPGAGRKPFRVS